MKTRMIITAAIILISSTGIFAGSKERTITFRDALGRTLTMPVMVEAAEEVPFDTKAEFERIRSADASRVFDLTQMIKPEEEEPLPFDLQEVFESVKNRKHD